jgi:hypothetical protein
VAHVKTSAAKRRRALAFAAVAVAFLTTSTYWLAAAGSSNFTIGAPAGLAADGSVADVQTMSATVTRSNGSAYKETGKTIAKLKIAKDYTSDLRISIVWTNPVNAAKVLNNPNAQITIGLYRPVSLKGAGACSTAGALVVTDGATTFCTLRDGGATGSGSVSSSGELLIAKENLAGFLSPTISAASASSCVTDTGAPTAWCQPSTDYVTASERLLYVIASITVPGGIPQGQQNEVGTLDFYVQAKLATNT